MTISRQVDNAILAVEYRIAQKEKNLRRTEEKTELTENEKLKVQQERAFINDLKILVKQFRDSMAVNLGKIPPHDLQIEEYVLGAVLLQSLPALGDKSAFDQVQFLQPDHFYREAHQIIFKACQDIHPGLITMMSVTQQLRKTGQLEAVGGAYYLAQLTQGVVSSSAIEWNARVMMEFAIKRRLIMIGHVLMIESYDDGSDCFENLDNAENEILQIKAWAAKK